MSSSMFTTLLFVFLFISFGLWAFGIETFGTQIISGKSIFKQDVEGLLGGLGFGTLTVGTFLGIAAASLLGGGFSLPVILAAAVGGVLIALFTVPVGLFNSAGVPPDVVGLLTVVSSILQFLFTYSLVNWIRGTE